VSDELLRLAVVRLELRDAVLTAVMAPDGPAVIGAWTDVDQAAVKLARERKRYERHVREVCAKAGRAAPAPAAAD
jgi:hypothetical protein